MPKKKTAKQTAKQAVKQNTGDKSITFDNKMSFSDLVSACNPDDHNCYTCNYKLTCRILVLKGIPKPYQYKGMQASIMNKKISEII